MIDKVKFVVMKLDLTAVMLKNQQARGVDVAAAGQRAYCNRAAAVVVWLLVLTAATLLSPVSAEDKPKTPEQQSVEVSQVEVLTKRVAQLEEQVVDLQVAIGTLESLANPGRATNGRTFSAARSVTTQSEKALQAQVRALSAQVETLRAEVRALQARGTTAQTFQNPPAVQRQAAAAAQTPALGDGFGATVVSPAQPPSSPPSSDSIGSLIEQQDLQPLPAAPQGQVAATPQTSPAPPQPAGAAMPSGEDARSVYEASYNLLLQQDFAGAQQGFRAFLRKFPQNKLVPNALYWLGETYYVQENYTDAAEAFDIVTAAYTASNKAPDSQLKRGMALANLGKRREACSVLGALAKRFPKAPDYVKSKAASERDRVGCS